MRESLILLLETIRGVGRSRRDLMLENLALRHQLTMCDRRPRMTNADRTLWTLVLRRRSGWRGALIVLEPATVRGTKMRSRLFPIWSAGADGVLHPHDFWDAA